MSESGFAPLFANVARAAGPMPRIAVASLALVAVQAYAQSSVTISGKVEASIDYLRISGPAGSRTQSGVSSDSSRLIVAGREDLGGGWSAKFKLDSQFAVDTGVIGSSGGIFFGRESMVGLEGPYGDFRLGRNYIPMDELVATLDPFYFQGIGASWPLNIYTPRIPNSFKYHSPQFGGSQVRALASSSEGVRGAAYRGLGASYAHAVFDVHAAYTFVKNAAANGGDRKELMLGGDYKFAGPRLTGFYIQREDDGQPRRWTALVGTNWPLAVGEVRASYQVEKQAAAKATRVAVQYLYPLSKRTSLFGGVARLNNSAGFSELLNPALPVLAPGEDVTGTQIGIRHSF